MTNTLTQLQKRINNIMKNMSNADTYYSTVIFNKDFEKWNLNMRGELVDPVFKRYKRLFQLIHYIFSYSTIYNISNIYNISHANGNLVDSPAVWHNHLGGFEGARQKGWTIHTVCLLELVSSGRFSSFSLLGFWIITMSFVITYAKYLFKFSCNSRSLYRCFCVL